MADDRRNQYKSCQICLIEFEPKTTKVHVVNGAVHEGCYCAYVHEENRKQRDGK